MINIVIADDHHIVRQSLRVSLDREKDFCVVGEAADGLGTVETVMSMQPDILIVDLMMGGVSGLDATRQICKRLPSIGVIILSMYSLDGYVVEALRSGAKGYILKESTSDELVLAVRSVAKGQYCLSPSLSERAIDVYKSHMGSDPASPYSLLTTREREIFGLVIDGNTSAKIGERLYISRRTVEVFRSNIMRKLGVRNQTGLLRYALQQGLLPSGESPPQPPQPPQ